MRLVEIVRLLRDPVSEEKRRLLRERWNALEPSLQVPGQGFGRQATGCGATIGVLPRCDFDCEGCYLGEDANSVAPLHMTEVFSQLDQMRSYLGPKGNVQITDGEVTLLPEKDLIAVLRYARDLGLIPMVMTHGDTFRRKPELLPRLITEGGLTEVSIHVDSLQRGRRGWADACSEIELMPLRDEFAGMIRDVRRSTGVQLRAATTMTVTRRNLGDIPAVVDWTVENRDAFGLISFQPLAQVGRTQEALGGVTGEELWSHIADSLQPSGLTSRSRSPFHFGHPECSRVESLLVHQERGKRPSVQALIQTEKEDDTELLGQFLEHLGGLTFRDDSLLERVARGIGGVALAPRWVLGRGLPWLIARLGDLDVSLPRLAWGALRRTQHLGVLTVVSHHFMSETELLSERGQERLGACVFRVPVGREMVPMCEVNACGARDHVYAREHQTSLLPVLQEDGVAAP